MNPLSLIVVPYNRVGHLLSESTRIKELESAITTVREQHKKTTEYGMEHYTRIYNVGLYLLLFEYDIAILKNDALFSIRKWKKKFVARQMAIQLYEASHDIPNLLGKEFRNSLSKIQLSDSELIEFNSITKEFNNFKNSHREILNKLRNHVGAHRSKDAAKQLDILDEVSLIQLMEYTGEFYEPLGELISFMTKMFLKMADWRNLAHHYKK